MTPDPDDVEDATLSITLRRTPEGTLRIIEGTGSTYSLTVWADVLRDLADELDEAEIQDEIDQVRGEGPDIDDVELVSSPFTTVPAEA